MRAESAHPPLILVYHHVSARDSSRYVVTTAALERLLHRLLESGWQAIGLAEAAARGPFGDGSAPRRSFTVTFDDGMESFRQLAVPVLSRLGLLGETTAFVPTAYVGTSNLWRTEPTPSQRLRRRADPAAPLMTWDGLAEIAAAGVRVESHGHEHARMNELTYERALADARCSREALAEHGFAPAYFALPFGWRSEECKRAIRDAGFDAAFSVTGGGRDRYEIRRVSIHGTDDIFTLRLKTSGRYFEVFDAAKRVLGRN